MSESTVEIAKRFGYPEQWAQMHVGVHRCVDDRLYRVSCLVTDPTCEKVAKSYIALREQENGRGV